MRYQADFLTHGNASRAFYALVFGLGTLRLSFFIRCILSVTHRVQAFSGALKPGFTPRS